MNPIVFGIGRSLAVKCINRRTRASDLASNNNFPTSSDLQMSLKEGGEYNFFTYFLFFYLSLEIDFE